jgi:hypothetical protein
MLWRMAELEDELTGLSAGPRASKGDSLRALAAQLAGPRADTTPTDWWRSVRAEAHRILGQSFGRPALPGDPAGLSLPAAGAFVDAVARGLFGIDEHLDEVDVMPNLEGLADDQTWQLSGWLLAASDTLDVSYRPADQSAELRLAGARAWHLVVRFPWLAPVSCALVRRGGDSEGFNVLRQSDGSSAVDVHAAPVPARISVTPRPCGP